MDVGNVIALCSAVVALLSAAVAIQQAGRANRSAQHSADAAQRSADADEAMARLAERQLEAQTRYKVPWKVEQRASHTFVLLNQGDLTETNVHISHEGTPEAAMSQIESPCTISAGSEHRMNINYRSGKIVVRWVAPGETAERKWSAPVVLVMR